MKQVRAAVNRLSSGLKTENASVMADARPDQQTVELWIGLTDDESEEKIQTMAFFTPLQLDELIVELLTARRKLVTKSSGQS